MSTAYPPRLIRYLCSSKKERNAARTASMKPGFYGQWPEKLGLYYWGHGTDFLSLHFHLATMDPRQDVYAVSFHKGPGSTQATIYSTPEHGSVPLSVAVNEKRYSSSASITIAGQSEGETRTERVGYNGFATYKSTYTMNGETFELREDHNRRPKTIRVIRLAAGSSAQSTEDKSESSNLVDGTANGRHRCSWNVSMTLT
jgi:hypothetical protein